jgi:hypothetical protein
MFIRILTVILFKIEALNQILKRAAIESSHRYYNTSVSFGP